MKVNRTKINSGRKQFIKAEERATKKKLEYGWHSLGFEDGSVGLEMMVALEVGLPGLDWVGLGWKGLLERKS